MLGEAGFTGMQYYGAGVLDWLAEKIGFAGKWIPPGEHLASFFGRSKVAPWILCEATVKGNTKLTDAWKIGDILQCPSCGDKVYDDGQRYMCISCNRCYSFEDGIIDLRV